jgi:flagellar M-ring protein FliF
VEQIVSTPGSVRRLNIGVVVPRGVSQDRLDRIRQVVSMAAGFDKQRGDGIAVYSLDQMSDGPPSLTPAATVDEVAAPKLPDSTPQAAQKGSDVVNALAMGLFVALAAVAAVAALAWTRRARVTPSAAQPIPVALLEGERAALLDSVQQWLGSPSPQPIRERAE